MTAQHDVLIKRRSIKRKPKRPALRRAAALFCAAALAGAAFAQEPPPLKPGVYAVFNTSQGSITAELYEKDVPKTVRNFIGLAQGTKPWLDPQTKTMVRRPLYDNITFHRVTPGVMIQSGDPTGKGNHNCGISIADEFLPGIQFSRAGRLAMANTGAADSGGCQFFITDSPMPSWNGKYTIFGQVVRGQNVVTKIHRAPSHDEKPVDPVTLSNVTISRIGTASGSH
jgi:cyclophilin family peptidyl-prolyl cis-trans isomerase